VKDLAARVAQNPALFMACRSILENGFRQVRRHIRAELRPGSGTLHLGCGTGAFADLFTGEYTGIDLNRRYIEYARAHRRGTFLNRDATAIGEVGPFAQVLIFGLLHHLTDDQVDATLAEVRRVLTSTGVVLAIEDIPTASKANVLGHLLHRADGGSFIRANADYTRLYQAHFRLERDWTFRSGICDYSACVLRP